MRRLLIAAALSAIVLGVGGCSTDKSAINAGATPQTGASVGVPSLAPPPPGAPSASGAPAPSGSVNPGDAALSGDTRAICNQAAKVSGQFGQQVVADLKLLIAAESAANPGVADEVKQKTTRDVQSYAFALNDLSKLVADPTVKKALADMSQQVTAAKGDVRKLSSSKLDELRATLEKACGK